MSKYIISGCPPTIEANEAIREALGLYNERFATPWLNSATYNSVIYSISDGRIRGFMPGTQEGIDWYNGGAAYDDHVRVTYEDIVCPIWLGVDDA